MLLKFLELDHMIPKHFWGFLFVRFKLPQTMNLCVLLVIKICERTVTSVL